MFTTFRECLVKCSCQKLSTLSAIKRSTEKTHFLFIIVLFIFFSTDVYNVVNK